MFRSNRSFMRLTMITAVALLAACSAADQAVAPTVQHTARPANAPSLDVITTAVAPDSLSADVTVTPTGGMFVLGANAVYFPANSICDPVTSTYGPGHWDDPCEPLTTPINFHAEVRRTLAGQSWIDFTPAVRFVPTTSSSQVVWMLMKIPATVTAANYASFGIQWMPNGTPDVLVNEALTDPTLKTYVDVARGVSFRRVKHFSGYIVFTDVAVDPLRLDATIPLW